MIGTCSLRRPTSSTSGDAIARSVPGTAYHAGRQIPVADTSSCCLRLVHTRRPGSKISTGVAQHAGQQLGS
eukprot:3075752-Rhodomonas_salina.1